MEYFLKINGNDYSMYVNHLRIAKEHNYQIKTSANGADRVSYKYSRRIIEVGIIPLNDAVMSRLLTDINKFRVTVSFRNPETNALIEDMTCIIPDNLVDYYTIQAGKVMYKAFTLKFIEL